MPAAHFLNYAHNRTVRILRATAAASAGGQSQWRSRAMRIIGRSERESLHASTMVAFAPNSARIALGFESP